MTRQTGNLSGTERGVSALVGLSLLTLAGRRGNLLLRILSGMAGTALLARSYAGHCGVRAAVLGTHSLREGMSDQWKRMLPVGELDAAAATDKPDGTSAGIDATINDSFPASDPAASRLPDEPPVNAQDKWEAAKAAGGS